MLRRYQLVPSLQQNYRDVYPQDSREVEKAKKHLKQDMYDKNKARAELSHAYANQWTDYKNSRIGRVYGPDMLKTYASQGKMFDDNGDLVDIDYDYYATVPQGTLRRVFGDGADDVRRVIDDRDKVANGKIADVDYSYYASTPNRIIDVVFGDYADNVRNKLNREGK